MRRRAWDQPAWTAGKVARREWRCPRRYRSRSSGRSARYRAARVIPRTPASQPPCAPSTDEAPSPTRLAFSARSRASRSARSVRNTKPRAHARRRGTPSDATWTAPRAANPATRSYTPRSTPRGRSSDCVQTHLGPRRRRRQTRRRRASWSVRRTLVPRGKPPPSSTAAAWSWPPRSSYCHEARWRAGT